MNLALAEFLTPQAQPNFTDGFGERRQAIGARNERLELLRLSSTLSAIPTMEAALRDRAARLSEFRHESFARLRAVDVDTSAGALLVYSDHVSGVRLSSLLAAAEKRSLSLDLNAVRGLVRQLVRAAAAWHEALPDIAHGAIGPERIIITPNGTLVIADCVLGSALDQLRYSRDRYWTELRVALPPAPAVHAFDARTDVAQIGLVALALVLGRRLTSDVYPGGMSAALQGAWLRTGVSGALEPLPLGFRDWLRRAMQLDPRDGFVTARDAAAALDDALGKEDEALERDALHVHDSKQAPDPARHRLVPDEPARRSAGDARNHRCLLGAFPPSERRGIRRSGVPNGSARSSERAAARVPDFGDHRALLRDDGNSTIGT